MFFPFLSSDASSLGSFRNGRCVVPGDLCEGTQLNETLGQGCEYEPVSQTGLVERALRGVARWKSWWSCPDMELSDSWGAVPGVALEHWVSGDAGNFTVDAALLLVEGRAGVRVGNLRTLKEDAAEWVNPSRRREPLVAEDGKVRLQPLPPFGWFACRVSARADGGGPTLRGRCRSGAWRGCCRMRTSRTLLGGWWTSCSR